MLQTDLDRSLATRASTDRTSDRLESLDDVFDLLHTGAACADWGGGRHRPWVHATQTAALARQAGACEDLITAALLHDIGQLLSINSALDGFDDHHAELGADWLTALFPPQVTEPIRLRARAKRYLLSTQPVALESLAGGALRTFNLRDGLMNKHERLRFMTHRHAGHALRLSHWDDVSAGEMTGSRPRLEPFRGIAARCLRSVVRV